MPGSLTVRIIAVLLLLIGGAEAYACHVSDACVSTLDNECDQPSGDNCLCCCHHAVPVAVFALAPCDSVVQEHSPEPVLILVAVPFPIDHPPNL